MAQSSPIFRLPVEVRLQIYSYILPHTKDDPTRGIVWIRGCTSLFLTNRQIYSEASALLYGCCTMLIDIAWDGNKFQFNWLLPSGLVPNRTYEFPNPTHFAGQNLR